MGLFTNPYYERKKVMIDKDRALYGRDEVMNITGVHYVKGTPIKGPFDRKYEIEFLMLGIWHFCTLYQYRFLGPYIELDRDLQKIL